VTRATEENSFLGLLLGIWMLIAGAAFGVSLVILL
jgi:hypothetical protein